jgi:hypothetical protein
MNRFIYTTISSALLAGSANAQPITPQACAYDSVRFEGPTVQKDVSAALGASGPHAGVVLREKLTRYEAINRGLFDSTGTQLSVDEAVRYVVQRQLKASGPNHCVYTLGMANSFNPIILGRRLRR